MSESHMAEQVPRCCGTCEFWRPDDHKGTLPRPVWGYCQVGLGINLTLSNRTTTDLTCCTAYEIKKPPKDEAKPAA